MLLRRGLFVWMLLSTLIASAATAKAGEPAVSEFTGSAEAGMGTATFRLGYYNNDDNGDGNPFLDEELTIIEPIVIADFNVTDRLAVWFQYSYDHVSSASIDRLSKFPNQSGASGDNYNGFDVGARFEIDEAQRVGGFVNWSSEYDYSSVGFGGDYARDLAEKNTTLKFSANAYFDKIDVIRFNGLQPGKDDRTSVTTTASWYQVFGPRLHADMGATFSIQNGFLETAYNAVVVEDPDDPRNDNLDNRARGIEFTEELPGTRLRGSLFGKARYSLVPGTALELGGRLYQDSWGIFGLTVEPRVRHQLIDSLGLRVGYRFYLQTAADDFKSHFTSLPAKRTQDSDLAKFNAHGINAGLLWQPFETLSFDVTAGYTFRDDGIDQLMLSAGVRKSFDTRPLGRFIWDSISGLRE